MALIDPQYLEAIKRLEGFTPTAQWDYRQNSNGYGTRALYPGETIDRDTAEQRFQAEIQNAANQVNAVAPDAPAGVKAALTSLTYNAGPKWINSGLGELVKAGDYASAAQRLQEYNKAGGQVLPGLQKRRSEEASWFDMASAPTAVAQNQSLPAYSWSPSQQAPQPAQSAQPAQPQAMAGAAPAPVARPQAPSLSFEQIGHMLGLDPPPPLQMPQPMFAQGAFGAPFPFRRT